MVTTELFKDIVKSILSKLKQKDYYRWKSIYTKRIAQYRNLHEGEDCFIIGNGPSLNEMNLEKLNNYYSFGLNKIHLIFEKVDLDLSYHVAVNKLVIEQIKEELETKEFGCPSFISYTASKELPDDLNNIIKIHTRGRWSFYKELTDKICEGYTVTYVAMQIAYYMGFKRVFLIGVDHNFAQKGDPNEEQLMSEDDVNHFHPDYFKGNHWHLADIEGNEASYALAKHQYHADNRQILDATVDGELQIFPKISFDKALELADEK